jgi:hypothetical protein
MQDIRHQIPRHAAQVKYGDQRVDSVTPRRIIRIGAKNLEVFSWRGIPKFRILGVGRDNPEHKSQHEHKDFPLFVSQVSILDQ